MKDENYLRRLARNHGLRLTKSRTRNEERPDYGLFGLVMPETGGMVNPPTEVGHWPCSWDLDQIEAYLNAK